MRHLPLKACAAAFLLSLSWRIAAEDPSRAQKERTVAALEKSLQADPQNADLWVHLAFAHRKLDRLDQALAAFEKAATLDPKNEDALYMMGLIYEKKEMKAEALRTWGQYLKVSTNAEKKAVAEKHIHHLSQ